MRNSTRKSLIIIVFVLIQIIGGIFAVSQGEKNKLAHNAHMKALDSYRSLLITN